MMEPSFEKLLVLLAERRVRFLVVGGVAVALQGYVRLTDDVDILVEGSADNIDLLLNALAGFGEGFASELVREDFDDSEGAIRIVEESEQCQIDVFTRMGGRRFADVIGDAGAITLGGFQIPFASKAALIAWKERSGREKDRLDVLALRQLQADPHAFD